MQMKVAQEALHPQGAASSQGRTEDRHQGTGGEAAGSSGSQGAQPQLQVTLA